MVVNKVIQWWTGSSRRLNVEQLLIEREAQIGARLFGPVPAGRWREFFCLDENTWVWHEQWYDRLGRLRHLMTRYDVYGNKIYKRTGSNGNYQQLSPREAANLKMAIEAYRTAVAPIYQSP